MAFSSIDDLVNEITTNGKFWRADWNKITGAAAYTAGRWYDLSTLNGTPIANAWAGTSLTYQACTSASGFSLYHGGNVTPDTKHILNMSAVSAVATAVPGVLMLVDMQGYWPGINMNSLSLQTLSGNPSTFIRYANGVGCRLYLAISSTSGATAHNLSVSYVDQSDNSNSLPVTVACTASAIPPHITHSGTAANNYGPFLPLASGDTGVKNVNSVQLSAASGAGTAALVLCKPLAQIPIVTAAVLAERDLLNQLPSLPQVQDDACLTWLYFTGAAAAGNTNFYGGVELGWG